jgi:alkylhydroperoxidase family enzyme
VSEGQGEARAKGPREAAEGAPALRPADEAALEPAARAAVAHARIEHAPLAPLALVLANAPDATVGVSALLENVLTKGRVPRTTKELALLAAAQAAGSAPIRDAFARVLSSRGLDDAIVDDLANKGESSRLPDRTQRILAFVRRAATTALVPEGAELAALRKDGIGDAELAELAALAGLGALLLVLGRTLEVEA